MSKIWFDGKLLDWNEVNVHVLTHSLHYGGSAWEGIRIYEGKAFMLKAHCQRLIASAKKLKLRHEYRANDIEEACKEIIRANSLTSGYIRPIIWLGEGTSRISGDGCRVHTAIIAWEAFNEIHESPKGLSMEIARWKKPSVNCIPGDLKAGGIYMMLRIIKNDALERNFDDAIVLDQEDLITEATTSNIFFIKDNILYTPAINGSFLNGITRQVIIALARALQINVQEKALNLIDLHEADAGFVTGTAAEIIYIDRVYDYTSDRHKTFNINHQLVNKIQEEYSKLVRNKIALDIEIQIMD